MKFYTKQIVLISVYDLLTNQIDSGWFVPLGIWFAPPYSTVSLIYVYIKMKTVLQQIAATLSDWQTASCSCE